MWVELELEQAQLEVAMVRVAALARLAPGRPPGAYLEECRELLQLTSMLR